MAKYRKKPVVIDAWQWLGITLKDVRRFIEENSLSIPIQISSRKGITGLLIKTLEGDHIAQKGDWIVRGVQGEFYPIKDEIFRETYEAVNGGG